MERRVCPRIGTKLVAICRIPASPHAASVYDISETGCRLTFRDSRIVPNGSTIHLDLGSGRIVSGRVARSDLLSCGVQFDRRLRTELAIDLGIMEGSAEVTMTPRENTETQYPRPASRSPHQLRRMLRQST